MKHPSHRARVSHDRWLVSYADFITLLFGFFVVLYAFARADEKKQAQIPAAIDSAFHALGVLPGVAQQSAKPAAAIATEVQVRIPSEVGQDLQRIGSELKAKLPAEVAAQSVSVAMTSEGLLISLREAGFFDSGSAVPKIQALGALQKIASEVGQAPYDVRVEGHSDNRPMRNAAFASNWELSSARATGITRLFIEWNAIAPERLSAAGFAEFRPVASNDTAEGRAQNRRVDLLIAPRTSIDFRSAAPPAKQGAWRKVTEGDPVPDPQVFAEE